MDFHEWWTAEIGHPPADEQDRLVFGFALRAWRAALAYGEHEVRPEQIEAVLRRVGSGETTHDDELLLRHRIMVGDEAVGALEAELQGFEELARQIEAQADRPPGPIPNGAQPLGGTRWRCPRCNFIGGLKKIEHECRGCGWPGDDTRPWADGDETEEAEDGSPPATG